MLDPCISFAKSLLSLFNSCLVVFFQSSLVLRCLHPLIACDMAALEIHQSMYTTLSAGSRVLTATKPLVLENEDVSRMDFGVVKSFLANVRAREVEITLLSGFNSGFNSSSLPLTKCRFSIGSQAPVRLHFCKPGKKSYFFPYNMLFSALWKCVIIFFNCSCLVHECFFLVQVCLQYIFITSPTCTQKSSGPTHFFRVVIASGPWPASFVIG